MKQRGRFLYQDPDGTIFIKFEHPGKGVPIESLLPENGRGPGFADFRIQDYFDLAYLVLAEPKEFAAFCRNMDLTGVTKDNPKKVSPPAPNLDFLKLRSGDGMDAPRAAALFEIVAAYWSAPTNTMGLEPGLVAGLWRRGMAASDIIHTIRMSTGPNGKIVKASGRGHDIMQTMIETYLTRKGLAQDAELPQSEMANLVERWLTATRSAPLGSTEVQNTVLHWSEYRRLGLVDQAGVAQLDQVRRVADKIFSFEEPLTFRELSAWVDHYHPPLEVPKSKAKATRALLKKKRKQGKLNRKRGRR